MPAQIETAGFCPQYASVWRVTGSTGKVWTVRLDGTSRLTCDCPGYQYGARQPYDRECKHTKAVWEHGCLYNPQWKDAGPNDYAQHGIELVETTGWGSWPEPCPGCGQPMIPVRIAV